MVCKRAEFAPENTAHPGIPMAAVKKEEPKVVPLDESDIKILQSYVSWRAMPGLACHCASWLCQ
jgi:hypothetical protein